MNKHYGENSAVAFYGDVKQKKRQENIIKFADEQVNLPKHLNNVIKEIRSDEKLVSDINAGAVGFSIYEYIPRNYPDIKTYSIRWVDIETEDFTEVETDELPF